MNNNLTPAVTQSRYKVMQLGNFQLIAPTFNYALILAWYILRLWLLDWRMSEFDCRHVKWCIGHRQMKWPLADSQSHVVTILKT